MRNELKEILSLTVDDIYLRIKIWGCLKSLFFIFTPESPGRGHIELQYFSFYVFIMLTQ